jgi:hypothetical protein
MARAEKEAGLRTVVREFGGYRGPGIQAQLLQWRNEADREDGIIGGGRDYYAVAPAGMSFHEAGAAFDLKIVDPIQRTDNNYRHLADIGKALGLNAGYYFRKKDEFHFELDESLADAVVKWQDMMRKRAAVVSIVALLVFFFPIPSPLAIL